MGAEFGELMYSQERSNR